MKPNSIKFIIQENDVTYFAWWTVCRDFTVSPTLAKYLGTSYANQLMIFQNGNAKWGTDLNNWHSYGNTLLHKIISGSFPLKELVTEHVLYGNKVLKLCRNAENTQLHKVTNSHFKALIKALISHYLKLNELGFVAVVSDLEHGFLSQKLKDILENKHVKPEDLQSSLNTLMTDEHKNMVWQEMSDFIRLNAQYKSLGAMAKSAEFKLHVNKYCWVNFGYKGPAWTGKNFLDRARDLRKKHRNLPAALKAHSQYLKDVVRKRKNLEQKLKLTFEEKRLFATARTFSYLKNYRVDIRHYFCFISYKIIRELAKRFDIPIAWFEYARESEIYDILSGKSPKYKKIMARKRFHSELWEGKTRKDLTSAQLKELLRTALLKEKINKTSSLAGQAAFLGSVTGKAKVILHPKEAYKVKKGDILIAVYTDPNLLPAMEQAAAFVTDQGGITSHAAIVAREMKKPCIIGTKIATKVFKDGDEVKVDANRGIISKL